MNITVKVIINSSKNQVWAAITNIENSAKMLSDIIDLTIIEKPQQGLIGLKWQETRKVFGKTATETMWITDALDNEYYCTRAENCGTIYTTKLSLATVESGTCLAMNFKDSSDSIWLKIHSAVMGLFIKTTIQKMLSKDLNDIKYFIENSSTTEIK